jgi:TATA-binding protein-associated factor Taf7
MYQMSSSESDIEVGFDEEDLDLFDKEEENSEISDGENFNSG